jgi:DNA adenine methylase
MTVLQAPFPYFGGKATIARDVWARLGDVTNYVEPFFGSGAMLLARPTEPNIETVNDLDGYVANFWRAIQADPDAVAFYADNPVFENDLHARHYWLKQQRSELSERMEGDPYYYDAQIAGWWAWCMSCWIGGGLRGANGPWSVVDGRLVKVGAAGGIARGRPHLGGYGSGVNKLNVGDASGINRKCPLLAGPVGGNGIQKSGRLVQWFADLANRLANVRVCCGDWMRVTGRSVTYSNGLTGVFLDPPYSHSERDKDLYTTETDCSADVRQWAIDNGDNPLMRIALCGYDGEHAMPDSWECFAWKASGGYSNLSKAKHNDNCHRERIWFSPHCLSVEPQLTQASFFEFIGDDMIAEKESPG